MKGPVYIDCRLFPDERRINSYTSEWDRIWFALRCDKKDTFVLLIHYISEEDDLPPDEMVHWMFDLDSKNCVAAVLDGETWGIVEFTADAVPSALHGTLPILHQAALFSAPRITKFCLQKYGSQANLRIDVDDMKGVRPLDLILKKIRSLVPSWSSSKDKVNGGFSQYSEPTKWMMDPVPKEPEQLAMKLLFHLYKRYLRTDLETLRLIAQKTNGIEQEFLNYLKEQKLIELVALLLVARDKVMPGSERRLKIQNLVLKEIASLNVSVLRSMYDIGYDKSLYENQKMEMEAILLLLEMFKRIGDKLSAYLQIKLPASTVDLANQVAWLLKEAGFDAKLGLLDEAERHYDQCFYSGLFSGYDLGTKNNKIEDATHEMNEEVKNESPQDSGSNNSSDKVIGDAKQSSILWLGNKKNLSSRDYSSLSTRRSFHIYHFARASLGFGSTIRVNKVYSLVSELQFKKQYLLRTGLEFRKSAEGNRSCNGVPNLQFNRYRAFSTPTLSRGVAWMICKMARALRCQQIFWI